MPKYPGALAPTGMDGVVAAGLPASLRHVLAAVALGLFAHPVWSAGLFTPLDAADSARLAPAERRSSAPTYRCRYSLAPPTPRGRASPASSTTATSAAK